MPELPADMKVSAHRWCSWECSKEYRTPSDKGDIATQIGHVFGMERNEFVGRHCDRKKVSL